MAACDDSLFNSEGETWSFWAENIGFNSPNSDFDDDEINKVNQEKTTTRLSKDDMSIYGYCPRWEDFYLVVCDICGQAIKPQALRQHIALRHSDEEDIKLDSNNSKSYFNKADKAHRFKGSSIKFEDKLNIDDAFRENSLSPIDSLSQTSDNQEENIRECNQNFSSLSRSSESVITSSDFYSQQISPLLQMNTKSEPLEENFINSHISSSVSHRLLPSEPQHILPPPSPHTIPSALGSGNIGPPTPGRRPSTPGNIGPPTPGRRPSTPGMGPPTPGLVGPPTPGLVGPPTPGMSGPTTPGMSGGPPTPGMGPPTPGMGPPTPGMSPLTPGATSQVPNIALMTVSHGQIANMCPLTTVYNTQNQTMRSITPTIGQNPSISPLTPTHIAQSPNTEHIVSGLGGQTPTHGRPLTPALSPLASNLVSQVSLLGSQSNIGAQSPSLGVSPTESFNVSYAQSMPHMTRDDSSRQSTNMQSVEEEVNRISAMLMKEAEALAGPQSYQSGIRGDIGCNSISNAVPSHDIVEAQGLAGGGMRRGPLLNIRSVASPTSSKIQLSTPPPQTPHQTTSQSINASQPMGSVPVPMSSMSMETLKQIQDDLLATVSESELNAVLGGDNTPDNTTMLSNNSQCYRSSGNNNIQYSDRSVNTSDHFGESPQLNNSGLIQYTNNNESISLPVIDRISNEMPVDVDRLSNQQTTASSHIIQDSYNNPHMLRTSGHTLHYNQNEKSSQNDELTRAVDSITKIYREENNSTALESQLAGLLQQPPASSSNIQQNNSFNAGLNSLNTPASQGITVVIGGGNDSITTPVSISLTSLATSLKKSSINSNLINSSVQGVIPVSHNDAITSHEHYRIQPLQTPENSLSQTKIVQQNHKVTPITQLIQQRASVPHTQQQIQVHISQPPSNQYVVPQTFAQHTQVQQQQVYANQASLTILPPTPSPKKSSKKKKPGERKMLPLKDREYDPEIHCGVLIKDTGKPCTRSLTCKAHSLSMRRNVSGRSKKFDELLSEHKAAKEAQLKASKPPETSANLVQSTPPKGPLGLQSGTSNSGHGNGPTSHLASIMGASTTSSPLLVRTLGGTPTYVPHPDPSPTSSYFHSMDSSITPQATPPSPACWPSQRLAPLSHSDNFYVRESPKPITICNYNARRLGGYLSTDHKVDILRSALSSALKKPQTGIISGLLANNVQYNSADRFNNVKPLLARKLQATIPAGSTCSKESLGMGIGYNGHIQLSNNGNLINSSALGATLKRPTQPEVINRQNSAVISAKGKSKKIKPNDVGSINYVSNVVQLDASGNKNHFPVVTVSLPNGLTSPQTITLGSVPLANVRNASNQAIRIQPPLTDNQMADTHTNDIVLGLGNSSTGYVITDALKPLKNDATGSFRLDGSKIISKGPIPAVAASTGLSLVGTSTSLVTGSTTMSNQTVHQPQVYFTAVSGNNSNTQLLQQLLNCRPIGKNSGMKLLGPNHQTTVTGTRQAFVLQQEKEPS